MDRARLDALFSGTGAAAWGQTDYAALLPHMDAAARERADALCPGAGTVLGAAFPYVAPSRPGYLSRYARGRDYHLVLGGALEAVCGKLAEAFPQNRFVPGADNSPLPEREAAWAAGLGLRGRNGLVILPPWGSWVFLGTVLTDLPFDGPAAAPSPGCGNCGRCAAACPGGALREERFDPEKCLSHLTQKKGELSSEQAALLSAHPLAWGCDRCQEVCPYNAAPEATELSPFLEDLVENITPAMVEGATNRSFRAQWGERAFAWRGPAVLRRNLALQNRPKEE